MKINDIIEVEIEKIVFGGEGLAYFNELAVFVPMSAIGDKLLVKIISIKKTYARGLIEKIIIPSKDRENIEKISFKDNYGCNFAMLKYEKQLEYKKEMVKDVFYKIGKEIINKLDIEPSPNIKNYRNKVAEPFVKINGNIHTGFFEKKSHNIFTVEDNILISKYSSKLLKELLNRLNEFKGTKKEFKVYNDISNSGFLKTCILRNNEKAEIMLVIVTNGESNISRLKNLLINLYNNYEDLKSVYISIKSKINNSIFGEKLIHIIGEKYISENIFDINFKIYPDSFFQINTKQSLNMYEHALSLLGDYKDKILIDAFSGTGTLSMIMAKKAKKVISIEVNENAVKSAKNTALENKITNIEFVCDKIENSIFKIIKNNKVDYILFDPPRKGISKDVLSLLEKTNIKKIVYISCEPSTLARDLQYLKTLNYSLKEIKLFDMFPQTHHVESVVLLVKE